MDDELAALLLHGGVDVGLPDLVQGVGQAGGVRDREHLVQLAVAACARPPLSTRNRIGQDNPPVRLARV